MKQIELEAMVAYLEEQVANHSIYVYGAQGQQGSQITERWIRRMEASTGGTKVGGKYYTYADLAVEHWQKEVALGFGDVLRAFDCSGLFMFYLMGAGVLDKDRTANGIHSLCKDTTEPHKGYMVFRHAQGQPNRMTHVGMLVSDDEVIHCKGRQSGCVKEKFSASYWPVISIPPWFSFDPPKPEQKYVHPKGAVRVREGNGTSYKQIPPTAGGKDYLPLLGQAEEAPNWYKVAWQGREGYISSNPRYTEVVAK